jgi:hypothetical protein
MTRDANDVPREQGEDGVRAMHDRARKFDGNDEGCSHTSEDAEQDAGRRQQYNADDATYSHVWRSKDYDYPCTPTGEEQRDDADRIYARVRTQDGTESFVPKNELVPAEGGNGKAAGDEPLHNSGATDKNPSNDGKQSGPGMANATPQPAPDDNAEIDRLARLPPLEYDKVRIEVADRLGVRVPTLDAAVKAKKREFGIEEHQPSAADILIDLSGRTKLFHAPDGTGYATIPVGDHLETWAVRSKGFRRWLAREFFTRTSSAPNSEAMQTALGMIEARAAFDSPQETVHVRVGTQGGKIYLDLADAQWRAVEISSAGWRIIENPPVRFRRSSGMLPLPDPVHGGSLNELRPFLNTTDEADFVLTVSFTLAALRERGPYPPLDLLGENGAAKSTFAAVLRRLIDPNSAPLRTFPRDERDLYIAAFNAHLQVFDNVSKIPDWMSDALCRLATGGGFATRQLFGDQDEVLFDATRPIILNGIEEMITRPDLVDRSIILSLKAIPDVQRKSELTFWADFERAHPRILGALLDGVVCGLRQLPETHLKTMPRMADFALWATACETAYWQAGTFAAAYDRNRKDAVDAVIEADQVATAIQTFMAERTEWEGKSAELLSALTGEDQNRLKDWPSSPRSLSGRVRRAAATLRKVGIEVIFEGDTNSGRKRGIRLARLVGTDDRPDRPTVRDRPNSKDINGLFADGVVDGPSDTTVRPPETSSGSDGHPDGPDSRPDKPSEDNPLKKQGLGRLDGWDANFPRRSGRAPEPPYKDLGSALPSQRCEWCGNGGGAGRRRIRRDGQEHVLHTGCVDCFLAASPSAGRTDRRLSAVHGDAGHEAAATRLRLF